jgi:hypothetical protein
MDLDSIVKLLTFVGNDNIEGASLSGINEKRKIVQKQAFRQYEYLCNEN